MEMCSGICNSHLMRLNARYNRSIKTKCRYSLATLQLVYTTYGATCSSALEVACAAFYTQLFQVFITSDGQNTYTLHPIETNDVSYSYTAS